MFIYKQPCKAHLCLNKNIQCILLSKANKVFSFEIYINTSLFLVLDRERKGPEVVDIPLDTNNKEEENKSQTLYDVNNLTSFIWYLNKYISMQQRCSVRNLLVLFQTLAL